MKKISLSVLILALVLALACVCCACNYDDIPFGEPVDWKTYLEDVADAFADSVKMTGSVISMETTGNIVLNGGNAKIYAVANYDTEELDKSKLIFSVTRDDGSVIVSLCADNSDTYIDIAPNGIIDNAKLKLQGINLFSWLNADYSPETSQNAAAAVKDGFIKLGTAFFSYADVNAQKTEYSFSINGTDIGAKLYALFSALSAVDEGVADVVLGVLGVSDIKELLSYIPSAEGRIVFYLNNGRVSRIASKDLKLADGRDVTIDLRTSVSGEYNDKADELFPKSDKDYRVTKVGSTTMDGAVSMISSNGNKYAVKYDMSLNTNLDLLKLAFNGFDLDGLGEDNFFHFRLSHKCGANCTEYCQSRIAAAKGAVLDIAYSPKHFGTTNVYISFNIRSTMSRAYIDAITRYEKSITASSLPDYCMFVIPAQNLKGESAFMNLLFSSYTMMMRIGEGGSASVDFKNIKDAFADNPLATLILNEVSRSEEFDIDLLKIKVDRNIYGQASDYDIYKEVVYIIDYATEGTKSYSTSLGKDNTAYGWAYEQRREARDKDKVYSLNNIYDASGENLLHGADANGVYVPMSDREAADLVGCTLKLDYFGQSGEDRIAYGEIIGVTGLDVTDFDVQEVTLRVKYPSIFDYAFEFGEIAEKILAGFFRCGMENFSQDVKVNIKLTREAENSFEFRSADTEQPYRLTHMSTVPEMLRATAVISYENGSKKEVSTIGTSKSVIESFGLLSKQYSIADWGNITVRFRVAGRTVDRYYTVEKPDSFEFDKRDNTTAQAGESCYITNFITVRAVYGKQKVMLRLTLKDFYINNICLDDDSADWEHYTSYTSRYIVFNKSSDYTVRVKKQGVLFGEFTLHISNKIQSKPSYKFNASTQPPDVTLKGARNNIYGNIVNNIHGDGDGENFLIELRVDEYVVSDSVLTYKPANKDDYILEFSVGSQTASEGKIDDLFVPSMIINPISVKIGVIFNKAGTYRINLKMGVTNLYTATLTVM